MIRVKGVWMGVLSVAVVGLALVGCDAGDAAAPQDANGSTAASTPSDGAKMAGGVAVIDLDEVAKGLGKLEEINGKLAALGERLSAEYDAAREAKQNQVTEAEKALGDEPTDEQKAEFRKLFFQAQRELNAAQQQMEQTVAARREQLVRDFRDQLRPIARRVAAEHGLQLVLQSQAPWVVSFDDQIDITDQVLDEAQRVLGSE